MNIAYLTGNPPHSCPPYCCPSSPADFCRRRSRNCAPSSPTRSRKGRMSYPKPARAFICFTPETILERPGRPAVVVPTTTASYRLRTHAELARGEPGYIPLLRSLRPRCDQLRGSAHPRDEQPQPCSRGPLVQTRMNFCSPMPNMPSTERSTSSVWIRPSYQPKGP